MQNHLKTHSKTACLMVFSCVLLISGLFGLQHAPLAHAASLQTARTTIPERSQGCRPPQCHPFPYHDLYLFTTTMVYGYNTTGGLVTIDDGNIGVSNVLNSTSGQFGSIWGVIARGNTVYEWRMAPNGQGGTVNSLFAAVYGGCSTSTGYCLILLDDNLDTFLVSAGITGLYQEHTSGAVYQLTGQCYHCWQLIDSNDSHDLVVGDHVYDTHLDGSVWRYNGTPYNWTEVDNNPTVNSLAVDSNSVLYELRQIYANGNLINSSVLQGYGPFNFQAIDTTHLTYSIVADQRLYQWGNAGILIYTGGNSWGEVPNNGSIQEIEPAGGSDAVYWELTDHSFWQYTPENGTSEILGSVPGLKMARPEWAAYGL